MQQPGIQLENAVPFKTSSQSDPKQSALFVTSFEKGLRVLEAISNTGQSLSLADVAEETGLDKSATQRFTYTLHALGYLHKDPLTKRYSLGPKVLDLGSLRRRSDELINRAIPILTKYNKTYGETVGLARLEGPSVMYLVRLPGRNPSSVTGNTGSRLPACFTAIGQVMLSFAPRDKVRGLLGRSSLATLGNRTMIEFEELEEMMAGIRDKGFAMSQECSTANEISVAAPIFDHCGSAIAAVDIAVSPYQWTVEHVRQELGAAIVGLSREISDLDYASEESAQIDRLDARA